MKTFIITELRENNKGEKFEVTTKIECKSLAGLVEYLKNNPRVLWNGKGWIKEDVKRRGKLDIRQKPKENVRAPLLDGEEVY